MADPESFTLDPTHTVLLLDIDGTLAPITADPAATVVPDATLALLERARDTFVLVGCVTGRTLERARELVPVDGVAFAAVHGAEIAWPDGDIDVDPAAGNARDQLQLAVTMAHTVGWRHEDKGHAITLHARESADADAALAQMRSQIATVLDLRRIELHDARKALELRPAAARTKADAARLMVAWAGGERGAADAAGEAASAVRAVIAAGDDRTDLDLFTGARSTADVGGMSALCVAVSSPEVPAELLERADLVLDDQAAVEPWLASLMASS